jgi:H+-transporting ATPase
MLQTDTRVGLTNEEVLQRRRKYGLNQMKYVDTANTPSVELNRLNTDKRHREEKENLVLKFLGFFVGPIQFVMEVRHNESQALCLASR